MAVNIGINGFGRIGRLALRTAWDWPEVNFLHINEVKGGPETAAHLLQFDSVHGKWERQIGTVENGFVIDDRKLTFSKFSSPSNIQLNSLGVDIVIESTGCFRTIDKLAPHLYNGAKKVIVAAPIKEGVLNIVMGVNDHLYKPEIHNVVTAASCTTNCLAPVVKVVHENLGILHGGMTTIHNVTNSQVMVDAPHNDLRRARSGLNALIPTTTGSAIAITLIYPELAGKLNGHAVRVPLLNASLVDCVFEASRATTPDELNQLFHDAEKGELKGILGIEDKPLVSTDYTNDPRSSIIDGPSTMVVDGTQIKVYAWYDNEWGYVNRMMELAKMVGSYL